MDYCIYASVCIKNPEREVMGNMDKVIMPELITPKFAEVIAENPEVLKIIVDHQPGEEVIAGRDCSLDCSGNPTNVKLVFCNVTIGVDETEDDCGKGCRGKDAKAHIDGCKIRICGSDYKKESSHREDLPEAYSQLKQEVAVLEARINEIKKILSIIPREILNRKVVARCKKEIIDAGEKLDAKRKELEYAAWFMKFGGY